MEYSAFSMGTCVICAAYIALIHVDCKTLRSGSYMAQLNKMNKNVLYLQKSVKDVLVKVRMKLGCELCLDLSAVKFSIRTLLRFKVNLLSLPQNSVPLYYIRDESLPFGEKRNGHDEFRSITCMLYKTAKDLW